MPRLIYSCDPALDVEKGLCECRERSCPELTRENQRWQKGQKSLWTRCEAGATAPSASHALDPEKRGTDYRIFAHDRRLLLQHEPLGRPRETKWVASAAERSTEQAVDCIGPRRPPRSDAEAKERHRTSSSAVAAAAAAWHCL